MMELNTSKWVGILIVVLINVNLWEVEGHILFFVDFLKCFNNENPVFISTDGSDQDFVNQTKISTTYLIRYTINKDEEQLADHLHKLHLSGDLTMAVFLDNGHHKLLNLLINEMELFQKGMTGLLSEADAIANTNFTLALDSRLYLYKLKGKLINLKEMYGINRNKIVQEIGTWSEDKGLSIMTTNMWERRNNLYGMQIRVATISYPLLHELHYDESGVYGKGLFLEPVNILEDMLNFTLKLMPSSDGQWGAVDENGTWNGVIGMLNAGQADIAAACLSITEARGRVVNFGSVIAEGEVTLISMSNKDPVANPWIYIEVFPHSVWYVICAIVVIITTCFTLINYSGTNYLHEKLDSERFTMINGLGLTLTFFRQIYYNVNINSKSTRILFVLSAATTYLLYVHYITYLTAESTLGKKNKINSFTDVLSSGYQVSVFENSAYHDLLKYSKPGTAMHEVYHKTMKNRDDAFLQSFTAIPKLLASKKTLLYHEDFYPMALFDDLAFFSIQVHHI